MQSEMYTATISVAAGAPAPCRADRPDAEDARRGGVDRGHGDSGADRGDLIDKGPHPVDVLRLLAALRASAHRAGGQVVITMGNHEAEFLAGPNEVKAHELPQGSETKPSGIVRCPELPDRHW